MYEIEIHEAAEQELDALRPYDRNRILDEIEEQLSLEPGGVTRRKKVLEAVEPPWDQVGPVWQLSVGDFRVFYDIVEERTSSSSFVPCGRSPRIEQRTRYCRST